MADPRWATMPAAPLPPFAPRSLYSPRPRARVVARRDKRLEREIARDRVARLVSLAEDAVRTGRADRAARYGELAWAVKTTYQLRGSAIDGRRCRKCGAFWSAANSRVRLREGKRVLTCLACGAQRRRPL